MEFIVISHMRSEYLLVEKTSEGVNEIFPTLLLEIKPEIKINMSNRSSTTIIEVGFLEPSFPLVPAENHKTHRSNCMH